MSRTAASAIALSLMAAALTGCAAVQVRDNTLQMVDSVSRIRDIQVLRNIAAAINDHDMVPTQILLSTGQASVTTEANPSIALPFNVPKATVGSLSASDSWSADWQVSPVTNADDLRRLRNLYVLIVSTDEQYDALEAYFERNPDMRAASACYGLQTSAPVAPAAAAPADAPAAPRTSAGCPPGYGAGQIPKWREALVVIETGDSIGCKLFQEPVMAAREHEAEGARKGVPFRRWLYWRKPGGGWLPGPPDTAPESLGVYGGWELGTTSRACFDDFVILAQSATPETAGASTGGAKVMLSP